MSGWETTSLDHLVASGVVQLTRGKIISKADMESCPGSYPVYSSAKENDGKFGEYGRHMFDEELITWSVDGGGRLFHRPRHKFSVTNVGGVLRIIDRDRVDYRFLFHVLTLRHSEIRFDWVKKAHPSVIRKLYLGIPLPSISEQRRIAAILDEAFEGIDIAKANAEKILRNARELLCNHVELRLSHRQSHWREGKLGDLCQVKTGKKDVNQGNPNGKFPFFTCAAKPTYSDCFSFDTEALLVAGNGNVGQVTYLLGTR